VGPQALADFLAERKTQAQENKWREAGLTPLRVIYYTYFEHLHHEPEDVYEMLKGYTYFILTRGL